MLDGGGDVRSLKTVKLFTSCAQQPDGFYIRFCVLCSSELDKSPKKETLILLNLCDGYFNARLAKMSLELIFAMFQKRVWNNNSALAANVCLCVESERKKKRVKREF